MAPFPEEVAAAPVLEAPEYSILKQQVDLDVDFAGRSLKGSTEITIQPLARELKRIKLHCRQCKPTAIQAGGITAKWEYDDPYRRSQIPAKSDIHQHEMLKSKIQESLQPAPKPELVVTLPPKLKIQELQADIGAALLQGNPTPGLQKTENESMVAETPIVQSAQQQGPQFAPIKLTIEFEVASFRDGIHWIGHTDGDKRFPCMYTKAEPWAGNTSCIFPCVDDATSRCSWDISIRCPKTLGDAFRKPRADRELATEPTDSVRTHDIEMVNGTDIVAHPNNTANGQPKDEYLVDLSEEDAGIELSIVCVGDITDDATDLEDETRHTVSFSLTQPVAARHIGFAIGPFEHVDLSSTRGSEEDERLAQNAVKVDGFCLPGQAKDLLHTCQPISWAIDNMGVKYGSFPFSTYQVVFVDDFVYDTVAVAGLSFCSTSLLFPRTVIEPIYRNTRLLVRTLSDQWMGVNVIAKERTDEWVVAGIAGFMTDLYMKELCGNNEFRWRQKLAAEKVYDYDVDRPSIRELGKILHLDPTIREFVDVKSALVLFILDRRLMKASGTTGVQRIINKIFLNAKTGALTNGEVSTADFQRTCEKLGHNKLESFFRQWVFQSGCPIFYVTQRFNKKKLVVEMQIVQKQTDRVTKPQFEPSNFMREIKEHTNDVWGLETNPVFTGPMTIRIHEADGTPYEHIVEIKEHTTRLEIPYNTKYKRLKRSRRQKERQIVEGTNAEGGDDALLYCLGDILDSEEEKREWDLMDWTAEDEEKMGQESYEWIRMDADFEWIGKIHLVMPLYMYISQLQQDRDIVAQYESMRYLLGSNPHHVSLSILVRTLMDTRYFWGIRELAAEGLALCANDKTREVGLFHLTKAFRELFCIGNTNMPKSNDFSDRRNFIIQCAIPKAMAKLRDAEGKVPMQTRQFFVDLLRFNDNSNNTIDDGDLDSETYSDNHYIATLMTCLADSLIASHREPQPSYSFSFGDEDEPMEPEETPDAVFEKVAIAQIERHRRIDEWDPSYQNIYSVTALDCLQRLTKTGIVKDKTAEVMQYVRATSADNVRLAAWRCLSEIGVTKKTSAMRYLLHSIAVDTSPRFRDGLLRIFGETLGHIALGDSEPGKAAPEPVADTGLVLEQEVSNETRQLEASRKTTPEGALAALRKAVENQDAFKEGLWNAATSRNLSIEEVAALCDIAALVVDAVNSLTLSLKLPRMWRCENMGQGKVKFIPHGRYRDAPRKELSLEDWQSLQSLGMSYTGPLSSEILKKQREAREEQALKERIAQTQREIQQVQNTQAVGEMLPPPPLVTPSTEKTGGFKISLGGVKRKQSVDFGAEKRAGSPKAPKLSKQQTPNGNAQVAPKNKGSPAASQRRSATPGSQPGKQKKSKVVTLRLGKNTTKAQAIVSSPPQNGRTSSPAQGTTMSQPSRSITPILPQSSAFPSALVQSPTSNLGFLNGSPFATSPSQTMNLGAFRSYGPPADADASPAEVKQEPIESPANGAFPVPPVAEKPTIMAPPPPRPKLTLKLSSRKTSNEGSPE